MYGWIAEGLVALHALFVVFVVFGGLLVLRWGRLVWLHLPAAAWGAIIEFTDARCPLTGLEKRARELAGQETYEGGFIAHYLTPILYPDGLTRHTQLALGFLVVVVNVGIYTLLLLRRRRDERGER